ncbi:MAG: C40 family peptidase [Alphaproteobacteria bacterium]|nr:C40 family peptidase [Alphaproteobacteria bacterium]
MSDLLHGFGLPPLHDPDNLLETSKRHVKAAMIDGVGARPVAPIKAEPDIESETLSELLYGEPVQILAEVPGWWFAISIIDGYMGWVQDNAVDEFEVLPSHRISAPLSHVYREPNLKSAPEVVLPMGSFITLPGVNENGFAELYEGGWIYEKHLTEVGTQAADPVSIAESFLGSPYLWGGRSKLGIDCSGLVQLSLAAAGHRIHRDSGPQRDSLGRALELGESPMRGDLAFFPGHVGFMIDGVHLLHANATHMMVTIDPLDDVISWVEHEMREKGREGPAFLGHRRL